MPVATTGKPAAPPALPPACAASAGARASIMWRDTRYPSSAADVVLFAKVVFHTARKLAYVLEGNSAMCSMNFPACMLKRGLLKIKLLDPTHIINEYVYRPIFRQHRFNQPSGLNALCVAQLSLK